MLLIIWCILIGLGLLMPKSKTLSVIMGLFMITVIGFRTQGADYDIYVNEFKWSAFQTYSDIHYPGYLFIEKIAHNYGILFEQWILIIGIISVLLTYSGIKKLTNNVNAVLALYFIYPFTHEAIQVRTFLANSLIMFSLPLILNDDGSDSKKTFLKRVLFFCVGAIACTFHFEAAIYVAMIALMLFLPEKYSKTYIFSFSIILFALIEVGILPKIVSSFNTRIAFWISGKTGLGIVIPVTITLLMWYLSQVLAKQCVKLDRHNPEKQAFYKRLLRLSDFIILLVPLFCYDITFNRLWRIFLIVDYIMLARIVPYKLTNKTRNSIILLTCILLIAIVVYENELTLLFGILENNGIFKSFAVF